MFINNIYNYLHSMFLGAPELPFEQEERLQSDPQSLFEVLENENKRDFICRWIFYYPIQEQGSLLWILSAQAAS